ncbi:DoxX family protein [Rhodococcus sp. C26F]|uniref:DoxX family protein n=2 Tax=Rhodococcus TaxID=1827 RepID=A0AAW4XL01_RHORH|nr:MULTISPECIES: DoxX family protein [Rhodococcus]KLL96133.1 membrane protein [Rhodococcus sp. IITR03]KSZ58700.1 membrane protein [Rhodococcus pyridinivorans KG-16]MCD2113658.1 DoxX family protein [Rhodococcus rhodochrous]QHG84710.1 DoxX family protein [Rhodococcus rhodochrous]QOH55556.1 DoxX family protein [Rhodococcus rhodochrous]
MKTPLVRDIGILIARLVLGVIFLAHGLQKFNSWGYEGTKAGFEGMGVPAPAISAFVATWIEILGGLALILGVLVPVFGVLLFLLMLGAFFIVHVENGIYVGDGGFELVAALGAGALLLAAVGAGAFSVDRFLARKVPLLRTA